MQKFWPYKNEHHLKPLPIQHSVSENHRSLSCELLDEAVILVLFRGIRKQYPVRTINIDPLATLQEYDGPFRYATWGMGYRNLDRACRHVALDCSVVGFGC